ncbi:unnamed protein product, partial [Rotaria sp. Silwood1]
MPARPLFKYLHRYKTGACRAVKKNQAGLPTFEEIEGPDEQVFYHTFNLLALQWKDKRDVTMLSP